MNFKKTILTLSTASLLTGCMTRATFVASDLNAPMMSSHMKQETDVKIFRTKQPSQKFVELGTLSITGEDKIETQIHRLQKKAFEVGGDAIIDIQVFHGAVSGTLIRFTADS